MEELLQDNEEENELFEHFSLVLTKGQELLRIDKFLMTRIENATRSKLQAAAHAGTILVNGKSIKPNYRVKPFDHISIVLSKPPKTNEIIAENIPIEICYEDETLIIVNKEAGMVVHPAYGHYTGTLINALMYHFNNLPFTKGNEIRPGLVHRIDKDTTGILVLAKTEIALAHLGKQFFDRTINRKYIALVWGKLLDEEGTITGNTGRSIRDRKVMDVFPDGSLGKHAVTHYKVIERFKYHTLVECKLETGRTHQIRVHFQHIGHPLFSDEMYGGSSILKGQNTGQYKQFIQKCLNTLNRQALHAKSLEFIHPKTGIKMFFDSDLPEDFKTVLTMLRDFEKLS
jgi:23S rRNA pseudouridine1911/1915/1917 synthase